MPLDAIAAAKAATPALAGGFKALTAWRRPDPHTSLFGLRVDRAIGDPGMVVVFANRWTHPVDVVCWGVAERKVLPWTAKLPILLKPDVGLAPRGAVMWISESFATNQSGAVRVPSGAERVFRLPDARRPPDHGGPKLVGLVEIAAFGLVIGAPKKDNWGRSDVSPDSCRCGHPTYKHGPRRRLVKMTVEAHAGACRVESCKCGRYRYEPGREPDWNAS